jgi:hypothetical protein
MDKFEFEIDDEPKSTFSGRPDLKPSSQQNAINFSVSVTKALEEKRKTHNSLFEEKVSLSQLKEVYRKAARQFNPSLNPNQNRGCWAMARVNMFTRTLSDRSTDLKQLKAKEALDLSIKVPCEWIPCSEDFFTAQGYIEKYGLNYDFKDIDELYLEDYKPLLAEWI